MLKLHYYKQFRSLSFIEKSKKINFALKIVQRNNLFVDGVTLFLISRDKLVTKLELRIDLLYRSQLCYSHVKVQLNVQYVLVCIIMCGFWRSKRIHNRGNLSASLQSLNMKVQFLDCQKMITLIFNAPESNLTFSSNRQTKPQYFFFKFQSSWDLFNCLVF